MVNSSISLKERVIKTRLSVTPNTIARSYDRSSLPAEVRAKDYTTIKLNAISAKDSVLILRLRECLIGVGRTTNEDGNGDFSISDILVQVLLPNLMVHESRVYFFVVVYLYKFDHVLAVYGFRNDVLHVVSGSGFGFLAE
ncbi:hypothetical protein Tco_1343842 [Tanacetum coccineum]